MHEVVALVLSGGGGERLDVLSAERAVSAIPFGGKYRIIDFVLSNCCHSEVDRVGVLTQHAPTSLHDHIGAGRPWDLDRRDRGVMVLQPYVTRGTAGWYRGTADAIAQNWDVIEELGCARVLVLSGDHVYRMDYRPLLAAHEAMASDVTLGVTRVAPDQAHRFGMVTVDPSWRVTDLIEKPERSESPFASMGIYLFETSVLASWLREDRTDLVTGVIEPMVRCGSRVSAFEFEGYWEDVGTIRSYHRASLDLVAGQPRFALDDRRWPILTRDEERPPVVVRDGARIEQSLVSNGCRIAGEVRRSVLSPGVVVEAGAVVEDSVVFSDSVIESGARVHRSIVDKYTRIGAGAAVGGPATKGAGPAWLDSLVLVGKDARVPGNAMIEPGVVIGAGALPEDFTDGRLGAGARIPNRTRYGVVA
ncbi:MAG TPA: sugar phosphate nucleotidyltransferase [Candidatus Udaeobacter sp.]|nr:sugar phosphate nucleotidyltransferase [Candidatus Udaeobacter sp.]